MTTLKDIDKKALPLKLGEALVPILKAISERLEQIQAVEGLVTGLIEVLAKQECKRRKEIPSWAKLTVAQKTSCRERAEETLKTINEFVQANLDGEQNG
jgi:hypothetical protein